MKSAMITLLILIAIGCFAATARAQNKQSAFETVQDLKLQLIEISAKEEMAKLQTQQLEESLKPENIEHSLAGVGSTKPEELREQRRRQLTIEKKAADTQLEQLTLKRSQLETALAAAEVNAYQQSASGSPAIDNQLRIGWLTPSWLLALSLLGFLIVAVVVCVSVLLRMQAVERALR